MTQKTLNTLFMKVASQDKAARVLVAMVGLNKQANKQATQKKVATIVDGVLTKKAAAGTLDTPAPEAEEKKWDKTPGKNWIPGVGTYRLRRRQKRQLVDDKGNAPHAISQGFGPYTSTLAAMLAGAGIGAGVGTAGGAIEGKPGLGAGVGAGAGAAAGAGYALLANLIGAGSAAFTPTRTKEQQKAYANSGTAKEYLIPGQASYNAWKTLGRSIADSDERKEKDAKEDKKEEKA